MSLENVQNLMKITNQAYHLDLWSPWKTCEHEVLEDDSSHFLKMDGDKKSPDACNVILLNVS